MNNTPHQGLPSVSAGRPLSEATGVMILVHGRGASAHSILELSEVLAHPDIAYLAPPAAGNTWYPYSFLAPITQNEPGFSSGLRAIDDLVKEVTAAGIPHKRILLGGFSQGACLASEYVARQAQRYGGLLVFSGGLIGPLGMERAYSGSLAGMPVFIGCSDRDAHIPVERVYETTAVLSALGAQVTEKIYPGMGHTINQDEIDQAMTIVEAVMEDF